MIRPTLTVLAGTLFAAACTVAQAQTSPPPNPQTPSAPNTSAETETKAPIPNGPSVNAELNSSVDSKKVKVGDKVEAHTTEALKSGNDVVIPKGTKLIGHVTEASARSKGDKDSSLAIQFDKAVPKKEQETPVNLMIIAVAPAATNNFGNSGGPASDPMANTGAAAAGGSPMGGRQQPQSTNSANYPTAGDTNSASANGGPLPANSRGVYGISGLQLFMDAAKGNQGTVMTSTGKEVKLDGGTRLLLIEQTPAPAASAK